MIVRKSMLQDYAMCPYKYYLRWIRKTPVQETYEAKIGRMFHNWACKVMSELTPPLTHEDLLRYVDRTAVPELRDMMAWFIDLEWKRYRLLERLGKLELWKPLRLEWQVEAELMVGEHVFTAQGHIDRVDKDGNGGVILIEYKTTRGAHLTQWRRELTYYAMIVEQLGYEVSYFVVINPMRREVYVERPNTYSRVALIRLLRRFLADTEFQPKPGGHCMFCDFRAICPEVTRK